MIAAVHIPPNWLNSREVGQTVKIGVEVARQRPSGDRDTTFAGSFHYPSMWQ